MLSELDQLSEINDSEVSIKEIQTTPRNKNQFIDFDKSISIASARDLQSEQSNQSIGGLIEED